MKSRSYNVSSEVIKICKNNDFVGLYKSAEDTKAVLTKAIKINDSDQKENTNNLPQVNLTVSREHYKKKKKSKKQAIELTNISIDGNNLKPNLNRYNTPVNEATSTQKIYKKSKNKVPNVKSIMKNNNNSVNSDDNLDLEASPTTQNRKKRNKSVSFMLDDNEEVVIKKTKVQEAEANKDIKNKHQKNFLRKIMKSRIKTEKENKQDVNMDIDNISPAETSDKEKHKILQELKTGGIEIAPKDKKKKVKKGKKLDKSDETDNDITNNEELTNENKEKKRKKKKRKVKSAQSTDTTDTDGEPKTKTSKKVEHAKSIAENLEHLTIGDNAHTLTNLLDEMTVVDKTKKKKNKQKNKTDKKKNQSTPSTSSSETAELEKIVEGRMSVTWKKRKWNKDMKAEMSEQLIHESVIVESLPLSILLTYRTILKEKFAECGTIKKIGIAEVHPLAESKPVFTTSIIFDCADAAKKALEEDNTSIQNTRIRVTRPLPATQTTLVVRSYAEMTDQNISSVFINAGKIRSIKHVVKGKKSIATAFVEFDGPRAVERAIKMAEDAKIGGKKIYVSKYEQRSKIKKVNKPKCSPESAIEGDSEDTN